MKIPVSIQRFGKQLASKMKLVLVLFVCVGLAKCEAGYDYRAPQTQIPSQYSSLASLSRNLNQYSVGQNIVSLRQGTLQNSRSSQQFQQQYEQMHQHPALKFQQPQGQQFAQQYTHQISQQYQEPIQQYSQEYTQPQIKHYAQQQVAQVHKHVYVHVAPEDPEPARVRSLPPVAPPQKHYKIIFVKTPSAPAPAPHVLPQQAQSEEKTIVYVLSKKAEEQEEVVVPTPAATAPSKPEVYFIKYQTKKEQFGAVGDDVPSDQFDGNSEAPGNNDLESISVESALRANELARLGGRAQPGSKYGTPEFQ